MAEEMIPVLAQRKVAPTVVRLNFNAPIMLGRKTKIHSIEAAQLCWGNELGMRYTKDQLVFRGLDTFSIGFEGPTIRMRRDATSGAMTLMLVGGDRHPASAPGAGGELTVQLEFYQYIGSLLTATAPTGATRKRLAEGAVPYRLWVSHRGRIVAACPCSDDPEAQVALAQDWIGEMARDPHGEEYLYTLEWLGE